MRKGDYIFLANGKKFYFQDPNPKDFNIQDIAHGLALTCRFGGQVPHFYSIAQHSIYVAKPLKKHALRGLLHDASEGYVHDIIKPLKRVIEPLYGPIEDKIMRCVYERFGLDPDDKEGNNAVKNSDMRVLYTEIEQLIPKRATSYFNNKYKPYNFKIKPWDWETARHVFLQTFYSLI